MRLAPTVAGVGASVTLTAASFVLLFGVVATAGVYGSRVAWLCGVAMPLHLEICSRRAGFDPQYMPR